jgi:hypothetical protein
MKAADVRKILFGTIGWLITTLILLMSILVPYRLATQARMETWASYAGKLQARVYFQEGNYRLLELTQEAKINFTDKFTGRKDGSFEIWTHPVYQSTNSNWFVWLASDNSDKFFVASFNERMKQLWNEKQISRKTDSALKTNSH